MNVLIDTNVILDVLLDRQPFAEHATQIVWQIESGEINGFLCATTLTTIDYFVSDALSKATSKLHIQKLLKTFEIAPVTRSVLQSAADSKLKDFEDAVLVEAARTCGIQSIITRNVKDFKGCGLLVLTPKEWLAGHPQTATHPSNP